MPPRGKEIKDVVSQLIYSCAGDTRQYEETIDAVLGALEIYVASMAKQAVYLAEKEGVIQVGDITSAIADDTDKISYIRYLHQAAHDRESRDK